MDDHGRRVGGLTLRQTQQRGPSGPFRASGPSGFGIRTLDVRRRWLDRCRAATDPLYPSPPGPSGVDSFRGARARTGSCITAAKMTRQPPGSMAPCITTITPYGFAEHAHARGLLSARAC